MINCYMLSCVLTGSDGSRTHGILVLIKELGQMSLYVGELLGVHSAITNQHMPPDTFRNELQTCLRFMFELLSVSYKGR